MTYSSVSPSARSSAHPTAPTIQNEHQRCNNDMAPRLNKRQLREQEELAALEAVGDVDGNIDVEESEEEIVQPVKSAGGGFAAVSH